MAVAVAVPAAAACVFFSYVCSVFNLVYAMVKKVRPALCRKIRMAQLKAVEPVKVIEPAVEVVEPVKPSKKTKTKS